MLLACLMPTSMARVNQVQDLQERFQSPDSEASPWIFWYWMNGAVTKEGITADLEAMKEIGLDEAILPMTFKASKDIRDKYVLSRLLNREIGDKQGKIYGMGHAVYTKSDPRAIMLKKYAEDLAIRKGYGDDFKLLEAIEKATK